MPLKLTKNKSTTSGRVAQRFRSHEWVYMSSLQRCIILPAVPRTFAPHCVRCSWVRPGRRRNAARATPLFRLFASLHGTFREV